MVYVKDRPGHDLRYSLDGSKMKKMSNNIFWLNKGEYTTCNADHPHFSIKSNKRVGVFKLTYNILLNNKYAFIY